MDDRELSEGWTSPSGKPWEITLRGTSTDRGAWQPVEGVALPPMFEMAAAVGDGPVPDDREDHAKGHAFKSGADLTEDERGRFAFESHGWRQSRKVRYFFEVRNERLVCFEVRVSLRHGSSASIRRSDLQAAAPGQAEAEAMRYFRDNYGGGRAHDRGNRSGQGTAGAESGEGARASVRRRRARMTPELLLEVAEVYERNRDDAPTQAVADRFGISLRTASERVRRAHRERYLKSLKRGGKEER